jgi:hypothetical protein
VINTYAAGYYAGFSGPDNGYGGGLHIGNNSTNDGIAVLQAGNNAFDLNVDGTDSVFLHGMVGNAGAGHRLTGNGAGIFSGQQTIAYNYGTVSASGTPTYLGIGQSATEGNVLWRNALYGSTITQIYVDADSAPGNGHTYTAVLRRGVANTATSCSFSGGSSFGCVMTLPMQATAGGTSVDSFDIALTADTNLSAKFTVTVMQQP